MLDRGGVFLPDMTLLARVAPRAETRVVFRLEGCDNTLPYRREVNFDWRGGASLWWSVFALLGGENYGCNSDGM